MNQRPFRSGSVIFVCPRAHTQITEICPESVYQTPPRGASAKMSKRSGPIVSRTIRAVQSHFAQFIVGARQKARLYALEQFAAATLVNCNTTNQAQDSETQISLPPSALAHPKHPGQRLVVDSADLYRALLPCPEQEHARSYIIIARENFTLRDIVKYGLISMGYAMDPSLFHKALIMPPHHWLQVVRTQYRDVDMSQAIAAGIHLLAQLNGPDRFPSLDFSQPAYPSTLSNRVTLSAMSCASAMIANATRLGVTPEQILRENSQSSFYMANPPVINLGTIPLDLVPTAAQSTLPHHPCIDLVPWPSLRSKFILAAKASPPLIDENDFALDLLGGGLRCWGSTTASLHGRGQGVPWDSRSWEMMPWFQKKWEMLLDGDDDIGRTSAWWRAIQGVDIVA